MITDNRNKPSTLKESAPNPAGLQEGEHYQLGAEMRWAIRGKKLVLQQACLFDPMGHNTRNGWIDVPVVRE